MQEFHWIAVAIIAVMASARLTRLAVYDHFPPVKAIREWYLNKTDGSDWQLLGMCGYCMGAWMTTLVVLSGYFSHWCTPWMLVCGILGGSYLAATYIANDGDEGDE